MTVESCVYIGWGVQDARVLGEGGKGDGDMSLFHCQLLHTDSPAAADKKCCYPSLIASKLAGWGCVPRSSAVMPGIRCCKQTQAGTADISAKPTVYSAVPQRSRICRQSDVSSMSQCCYCRQCCCCCQRPWHCCSGKWILHKYGPQVRMLQSCYPSAAISTVLIHSLPCCLGLHGVPGSVVLCTPVILVLPPCSTELAGPLLWSLPAVLVQCGVSTGWGQGFCWSVLCSHVQCSWSDVTLPVRAFGGLDHT